VEPIHFYFDYISPYAYVAWSEVQKLAREHERVVVAEPILFAALLNALGQKGPAEIPSKRVYTFKDAYRKAHRAGLPLVLPPSHPFNPLVALRSTLLIPEGERARAVTALFGATWGNGPDPRGIDTADAVVRVLDRAGFDGIELVKNSNDPAVKDDLRKRTESALALGVFGVPTIAVDGELFWGVDGLGFVPAFLRGQDPVPKDALSRWSDLPATATRK
jgi:2-hydroxychromene-2-carboxylate isomerase